MPLHINLNHEVEQARAVSRRDPLKLSMIGLAVVIAGFAAQFIWSAAKGASVKRELTHQRQELADLEPKAKTATTEEAELQKKLANSSKFERRIEGRFYWAPLLAEIIRTVPANIQITRLTGDASGEFPKKVQVNLDGVSAGDEVRKVVPREVAEKFRQALNEVLGKKYKSVSATFRHLEDGAEQVPVDGKQSPTATFAINIQFLSGEEPAATPPPRVPKKRP